ncbi:MAG: hypothetical protein IPM77_08150 [Crocinitomicaceae bacterium]|nr:hypothetical protein [Crocinitomicaceae bacterium]
MSKVAAYVFDSLFERKDQVSAREKLVVFTVLTILTTATTLTLLLV